VLPESESFVATTHGLVAVSHDGGSFVYSANGSLFLRRLDQIEARPIEGTSGDPRSPFFSPDGRAIGYHDFRGGALRRIAIGGGAPVTLAAVTNMFGARWGADDTIVFAQEDGIWRIPAGGGTATQVLGIARDERVHAPQLLPDGKTVLFTLRREVGSREWMNAQIVTQSLDGAERRVIVAGRDGRYLPTGHLVYAMKSVLMGVRFDLGTMQAVGAPVPLVEGLRLPVEFPGTVGTANYDLSDTGTLVYVASGPPATAARELVAVDRRGNATPLLPEMRDYWRPRLSPDGTRLVVEVSEDDSSQLWIVTVKDGVAAPLTSDGTINVFAAWSPDSRSVIHRSNRAGTYGIYRQAIDGLSAPQLLYRSPEDVIPGDVARDGTVVFAAGEQTGRRAIYSIPLSGGEPKPVVATPVLEHMPAFSPDGAWLAYVSNETGRSEVYIRLLDAPEGTRRRVSQDGGTAPVWSRDGRELFYRAANGYLTAVPTRLDRAMALGRPEALFAAEGRFRSSGNAPAYDVDASGRFIMVTEVERPPFARQIRVVLNWHEELNALLPAR
jgi:serine/threonine-protein kinase